MRTHLGSNHAPDVTTENGRTIIPTTGTPDLFIFVIITIRGYQPHAYSRPMLTVAQTQPVMTSNHIDLSLTFNRSDGFNVLYYPQGPFASCVLLDGTVYGAVSTPLDAQWGIKQCK